MIKALKNIQGLGWKHEIWALQKATLHPRLSLFFMGSLLFWPLLFWAVLSFAYSKIQALEAQGLLYYGVLILFAAPVFYFLGWFIVVVIPRSIANSAYILQLTLNKRSAIAEARKDYIHDVHPESLT